MIYPHKVNVVQLWVSLFAVWVHGSVNSKTIGSCIVHMTNPPVMFTNLRFKSDRQRKGQKTQAKPFWISCNKGPLFLKLLVFCCECNFSNKDISIVKQSNQCKQHALESFKINK